MITMILYVCTAVFSLCWLLAADTAVSRLEAAGSISAHVSSILAGSLLLFPEMLGGPGPGAACPTPLTASPPVPVPGSSGSGQFPGSLSGTMTALRV